MQKGLGSQRGADIRQVVTCEVQVHLTVSGRISGQERVTSGKASLAWTFTCTWSSCFVWYSFKMIIWTEAKELTQRRPLTVMPPLPLGTLRGTVRNCEEKDLRVPLRAPFKVLHRVIVIQSTEEQQLHQRAAPALMKLTTDLCLRTSPPGSCGQNGIIIEPITLFRYVAVRGVQTSHPAEGDDFSYYQALTEAWLWP